MPKRALATRHKAGGHPSKKPRTQNPGDIQLANGLILEPASGDSTAIPPLRKHAPSYHWPLLLREKEICDEFLEWFDGVKEERGMPWRKEWVDFTAPSTTTTSKLKPESPGMCDISTENGPNHVQGEELSTRAYAVWISETMLQQTRVATVIPYFESWMAKWPTVFDLAAAKEEEVLSVWKGLGYYGRARRLLEAARGMVAEWEERKKAKGGKGSRRRNAKEDEEDVDGDDVLDGPIPSTAEALMKFPGIGRYTAGAISSIAFGYPEPVVDGNVVRVLSRQMGLYVDGKDKKSTDLIWEAAERLIQRVAGGTRTRSAVPGLWNQAIMELGATVCTPRAPKCETCPVRKTCRAYIEGEALAEGKTAPEVSVSDEEDSCGMCEVLDMEDLFLGSDAADEESKINNKPRKKRKLEAKNTATISSYFTPIPSTGKSKKNDASASLMTDDPGEENITQDGKTVLEARKKRKILDISDTAKLKRIVTYCSLFPKKTIKAKVPEEACLVCMVELCLPGKRSKWLIEQRPAKGLLASLWQFPQLMLPSSDQNAGTHHKSTALDFISKLETSSDASSPTIDMTRAKHVTALGSLVHVFSHLRLTMHVHRFALSIDAVSDQEFTFPGPPNRKWVDTEDMAGETLSTGMRKCWERVWSSKE